MEEFQITFHKKLNLMTKYHILKYIIIFIKFMEPYIMEFQLKIPLHFLLEVVLKIQNLQFYINHYVLEY